MLFTAESHTIVIYLFFFFNHTATTDIYTPLYPLSLHDALPICDDHFRVANSVKEILQLLVALQDFLDARSEEHTSELQSHSGISSTVFCLKKKNTVMAETTAVIATSTGKRRLTKLYC